MSVSLRCPNCGANVGEASDEDDYKEIYYHKDNNGNPICENCGIGKFENIERNLFTISFVLNIIIAIILIFGLIYLLRMLSF